MKKRIQFFYVVFATLLLTIVTGCSSTGTGYSGSSSATYYHGSSWNYDTYYRSGVNTHYNRPVARANVRSGGAVRSGGRGGGGRR